MRKADPRLVKPIAVILLAIVGLFLLMQWARYPASIERYYTEGFFPLISTVLHWLFNYFPFSVGDVLYIAAVILIGYAFLKLVLLAIKRRGRQFLILLLRSVAAVMLSALIFNIFWGMNYYRPSLATRLNLPDTAYTLQELKSVTIRLIDSANVSRKRLLTADLKKDPENIYSVSKQAAGNFAITALQFKPRSIAVKPSLLSGLISYMSTSGYYNPFTGEAQINYGMPVYLKPFVACHELAHQMGVGPEDEASFASFVAGVQSRDRLLRYSAYYTGMSEFMYALRSADSLSFKDLKKRISPAVITDLRKEREYWQRYQGQLEAVTSVFYDNFLKANNQPQGLLTYNRMITLTMAWYRQQ